MGIVKPFTLIVDQNFIPTKIGQEWTNILC